MFLENGISLSKTGELYRKLEQIRKENELGLDRNIICRMGFLKSIDDPGIPSWEEYQHSFLIDDTASAFLIRKDVLLGRYSNLIVLLMKQRLYEDNLLTILSEVQIEQYFKAHIARGVLRSIPSRAKKISDIYLL